MSDYLQADEDHHKVLQCSSSADRLAEYNFPLSRFKMQMQNWQIKQGQQCLCAIGNHMDEYRQRIVADKAWAFTRLSKIQMQESW